jgi:hypothetical protein
MTDIPTSVLEEVAGRAFSELKTLPARLAPDDAVARAELEAAIENVVCIVLKLLIARLRTAMLREVEVRGPAN